MTPAPALPPAPSRTPLPTNRRKQKLLDNIKDALRALPVYFDSPTTIEGLDAGDLFSLNSVLGGTIEVQVVETLNRIRKVWDPDDEWPEHHFERSSQGFPDVRLVSREGGVLTPTLGIELKGWYLLAKEGVPSFRYRVTPAACDPYDLLVVVPWHLKNVLAGTPIVYEPFIEQARFAAEQRNYWWEHLRETRGNNPGITAPAGQIGPYPPPRANILDRANSDGGNNFGRIARVTGLMTDYVQKMLDKRVAGVEAQHWVSFFNTYADSRDRAEVARKLQRLFTEQVAGRDDEDAARMLVLLDELATLLGRGD